MKIQVNKNSEKLALYQNTIDQDLNKHYIRKLEPDEIPSTGWILPEHGVINPNKPGKLRRVSNAKSKFKGVCLNDMLLTGPDLLCNLLGVITQFREGKHRITADIEGMSMQVSVNREDRKCFRFLWGAEEPDFFEYTRFVFGAKCSPNCAIYALRTCADDNAESHPHIKKLVYENFYMDDFFEATDNIEVEHFMNTRPITTVSASPDDDEALTANHFLLGRAQASMSPLQTQQPSTLSRQWKFTHQLATHIWKRLMKEFIPSDIEGMYMQVSVNREDR
ncbi:uncharacterized protein LOC134839672 [Symsagittifera roscoffensis]|uniref:uncharacterized protein LOC134839672 n=1 Tax=Symsagittifera roscoffensis TaxID=84072 RepID=UPI00307C5B86